VARITEITSYSSYFIVNFGLFYFLLAIGETPAWRSWNPSIPQNPVEKRCFTERLTWLSFHHDEPEDLQDSPVSKTA